MSDRGPSTQRGRLALKRTAYHEAAHALMAFVLDVHVKSITIESDVESLGRVVLNNVRLSESDWQSTPPRVRDRLERQILVGLAGAEGERLVSKQYNHSGAGEDRDQALNILIHLSGSSEEAGAYYKWLAIRSRQIVCAKHRRPLLDALAAALLGARTLSGEVARQVYRDAARREIDPARKSAVLTKG